MLPEIPVNVTANIEDSAGVSGRTVPVKNTWVQVVLTTWANETKEEWPGIHSWNMADQVTEQVSVNKEIEDTV